MYFLARYITSTARIGDNIAVCGDFNCDMNSPEIKLLMAVCHTLGVELAKALVTDETCMTFSENNDFNSSSTNYFKLLALEEDMPVQLDHVFFTPRTLGVMPFQTSPDVAPFHQRASDESCVGVVLFTNNKEVPTKGLGNFPLSDHYGVGVRIAKVDVFGCTASVPDALLIDAGQHRKTIEYSAAFLTRSSQALLRQARQCYVISAICFCAPFLMHMILACDDPTWLAAVLRSPAMMLILYVTATAALVLGKMQRLTDSIYMAAQGEELLKLLT
jgi:uncharacterized membrane protein (DUF485 family)